MTSEPSPLPGPQGWVTRWIEPVEPIGGPERQRPVYSLAGEFDVPPGVVSATLHATAHGLYEAFLNGRRVGDCELTPGFTAYRKRLQVQSFDVTDLIHPGRNALGALLSDGWWRGQNGVARRVNDYGDRTSFLAQLVLTLDSGATSVFGTDAEWRSCPSHILRADLIAGEAHDLRRRLAGWAEPGTDRSRWAPVHVAEYGFDILCASPAPPVRRIERLPAVTVRALQPGRSVVDFGQNSNGWVRLRHLGPSGNRITLTYGEVLDAEGDVTQEHIAAGTPGDPDPGVCFQTDTVISAGVESDVFEPRHSTKGFRYVRVEGHPRPLAADDITGVVVHTDFRRLGAFECSDARLNALHRAAEWSFRGNACDIPTDCPTRERSGWTGDWQVFVETAAYLFDVSGFSRKWLRDLAAEQWANGAVTNLVPEPHPMDDREPVFWKMMVGSAGWGDAAVHVPWALYQATGDTGVLAEQWDSMVAWVDFATRAAAGGRHPSRIERSADPAPHERFLWDTGFHFGEWLEPGEALEDAIRNAVGGDHAALATAFLHRSARELAEIARVLGREDAGAEYSALARDVRDAWQREFIDGNGRVALQTQAHLVRALAFGLLPEELREQAASDLAGLVRAAGTHLATGFLATPFLLPVLADNGHLELAYELLFQDTSPSWLLMLERGGTTVWEEWEGIDADGRPHASLNHYSKGAVISFLHQYVAGLQARAPGYRRFRVEPRPGGGLTNARTHHDSPHGRIEVAWQILDGRGRLCDDSRGHGSRTPPPRAADRTPRRRHPQTHLVGPLRADTEGGRLRVDSAPCPAFIIAGEGSARMGSSALRLLHIAEDQPISAPEQLGPYRIESLIPPAEEAACTAYLVHIAPHSTTSVSYHCVAEEIYYVLEGSGTALLDGKSHPLRRGDFLRLPPGTTHGFVTGDEPLLLLDIHTPGSRPDHDVYFVGETPEGFGR